MLQPAFMKTGMTSSLKLIGGSALACLTVTGSVTLWPACSTVNCVAPSASGYSVAFSSRAKAGFAKLNFASVVTSRVSPSAKRACTMRDWRSRAVVNCTSGGKTRISAGLAATPTPTPTDGCPWACAVADAAARTAAQAIDLRANCHMDHISASNGRFRFAGKPAAWFPKTLSAISRTPPGPFASRPAATVPIA